MDTIEPPSFSLGFDHDDTESEPRLAPQVNPSPPGSSGCRTTGKGDGELSLTISDSDPEPEPGTSNRLLKRLRRGVNLAKSSAINNGVVEASGHIDYWEDEIEEISSPEDFPADAPASTRYHSLCSSSKVPLHGPGLFTSQASTRQKDRTKLQLLDDKVFAGSGISSAGLMFQKSTCSPLRRFQLLDSDSEEDLMSSGKDVSRVTGAIDIDLSTKGQLSAASKQKRNESGSTPCDEDLWRDFTPTSFHIPTPAFDEVCRDYFGSAKENNSAQKQSNVAASSDMSQYHNLTGFQQFEKCWDLAHPCPPSHRYFLHCDPRIRDLARNRLPNFLPLGIVNENASQHNLYLIDYMNQFGNRGTSTTRNVSNKSCSRGQTRSKGSKAQESINASEGWLNPRMGSAAPKDAGKRRVSAKSGSAGHWYTSPEGRKVYVSRGGQELSGQSAYRCYRKESGGGFRKSKKKGQAKKKPKH